MVENKTHFPIKQTDQGRLHSLKRQWGTCVTLSIAILGIVSTPFIAPQKASAWTGNIGQCSVDFGTFNWKDSIKNASSNTAHLDPDAVSNVLIYRFVGQTSGHFQIDMYNNPYRVGFLQDPPDITGVTQKGIEQNMTSGSSTSATSWEVDTINKTVVNNGAVAVDPGLNKYGSTTTSTSGDLQCIQTAKGYPTPYNWDGTAISEVIPNQGVRNCNGALDFGCWMGKAFNGIANTFSAVGQAILKGIAFLFAPDGSKTKTEFDGLTTFMTTKLGFLTYPFSFMSSIFTKFGDTTNNWCNSGSCSKSFGNFFGSPLVINFSQGQTTVPGIWSYMLLFIRGIFVLGIFFAILRKYREVTQR